MITFGSAWSKGVEKVIEIFDYLISNGGDFILNLMSPGYDYGRYTQYAIDLKEKYGNRIIIHGPLNKKEYSKVIKESLLVIAAIYPETFGCVFLESCSLGTPVITDNYVESLHEISSDISFVDYNNKEEVYQKILEIRSNRKTPVLENKFNKENVVMNWMRLFKMKYHLTIGAIFKNESHILDEWISHYIEEGVEHFYLIDNGSTDDYTKTIEKYSDVITLFKDDRKHMQIDHYNNYFLPIKDESEWMMIVDLDEFAYSKNEFNKISDYLKSLNNNISTVSMPWKMFGSSNYIDQPKSVIDSFLYRFHQCRFHYVHQKQILRTKDIIRFIVHTHEVNGIKTRSNGSLFIKTESPELMTIDETNSFLDKSSIHINHYAIQSYNWFNSVKCTRGDVNGGAADNIRTEEYFRRYDHNNVFDEELCIKRNRLKFPLEFDTGIYRKHVDLQHLVGHQLYEHYLKYGILEFRNSHKMSKEFLITMSLGNSITLNNNYEFVNHDEKFDTIINFSNSIIDIESNLYTIYNKINKGGKYILFINKSINDRIFDIFSNNLNFKLYKLYRGREIIIVLEKINI